MEPSLWELVFLSLIANNFFSILNHTPYLSYSLISKLLLTYIIIEKMKFVKRKQELLLIKIIISLKRKRA